MLTAYVLTQRLRKRPYYAFTSEQNVTPFGLFIMRTARRFMRALPWVTRRRYLLDTAQSTRLYHEFYLCAVEYNQLAAELNRTKKRLAIYEEALIDDDDS